MTTRQHLLILLTLTVLIRGVMFISYPLGPVLAGGFLLAVWERWRPALRRNIAARR